MRRVIAIAACICFFQTACFGSFAAVRSLYGFNKRLSNDKWVRELAFLGLTIIPAYTLFALGDILIFNSIEFWGGTNPIQADASKPVERTVMLADGSAAKLVREGPASMRIESANGTFRIERTGTGFRLLDETGAQLSEVREADGGAVELVNADGTARRIGADELALVGNDPAAVTSFVLASADLP